MQRNALLIGALAALLALTGCATTPASPAASEPDISAPSASTPPVPTSASTSNTTPTQVPSTARQVEGSIVRFTAGDTSVDVVIGADNATARDFLAMLPLTLSFEEFSGREKISYLPRKLNITGSPGSDPEDGDLIYFVPWGNLGFYYNTAGIGYSDQVIHIGTYNATAEQLQQLEKGDVTVTLAR
ncbi:cyclophilin-like fold protein [Nonomuraea sp. 10N515B]|uniref:cyclophilin-like fold protein n=1 Tax=Nonomuraea sp. 10N515B TaxID=3457422 RepID=UPI003FCEA915